MSKLVTSRPRIKGRILIRDKDGHPKFDDPKKIRNHLHVLSDEDIEYLRGIYGEFCIDDNR